MYHVVEIAIVGAGPAGAWAAYALARRGARVTLFDGSHPREKPCGGGVTGRALALVADAVDASSFPKTAIRSARFLRSPASGVGVYSQSSDSDRNVGVQVGPGALVVAA